MGTVPGDAEWRPTALDGWWGAIALLRQSPVNAGWLRLARASAISFWACSRSWRIVSAHAGSQEAGSSGVHWVSARAMASAIIWLPLML